LQKYLKNNLQKIWLLQKHCIILQCGIKQVHVAKMKIPLEQHETATHTIRLFELQGRTAQKRGANELWEVRTYKTATWWQLLFGSSTLEGVRTTNNEAVKLFSEVVAKIALRDAGLLEKEVQDAI
jgi:hypothetical protein